MWSAALRGRGGAGTAAAVLRLPLRLEGAGGSTTWPAVPLLGSLVPRAAASSAAAITPEWARDDAATLASSRAPATAPKRRERPHISSVARRMLAVLPENSEDTSVASLRATVSCFLMEQPEHIAPEWAEKVIAMIRAGTLPPHVEFYHFAMSVYAHDNQGAKALAVVDQMRAANVKVNALTCCSLMLNMSTCTSIDRAKILATVIRLLSSGEVQHVSSLHIKLLKCVRNPSDAALLDFVMMDLSRRWWRHLVTTQSFLVQALCKTQRLDEAVVAARTLFTHTRQGVRVTKRHPTIELKTQLQAPFGERLTLDQLQDRLLTSLDEVLERLPPRGQHLLIGVDLVDQAYRAVQPLSDSARLRELFAVRLLTFCKSFLNEQAFWPMRFSEDGKRIVNLIHSGVVEPTLSVFLRAAAARSRDSATGAEDTAATAAHVPAAARPGQPDTLPELAWLRSLEATSFLGSALLSVSSWVDLHRGSDFPDKPLGQRSLDALLACGIFSPETFNAMAAAIARDVTKPRARERLSVLMTLLDAYRGTGNKPGIRLYSCMMQSMVPRQSLGLYDPRERALHSPALTYGHLRRLQQMMEADGVKHDVISLTLMLRCLSFVRRWRAAVELFRMAPLIGCKPDSFMCFVALQGAYFSGREETAREMLHLVRLWLPDIVGAPARPLPLAFHRWFVLGSCMARDIEGALKYIQETALPAVGGNPADADVVHAAFLHGCLDSGQRQAATDYMQRLVAAGGPATALPYIALFKFYSRFHRSLHALGDTKEIDATETLFESVPERLRYDPRIIEEITYSRAILQNRLQSAIDLVDEMARKAMDAGGAVELMPLPTTVHLLATAAEELDPEEVSLAERAAIDRRIVLLVQSLAPRRARGTAEQEDDIADFVEATQIGKPRWRPPRSRRFQRRFLPPGAQGHGDSRGEWDDEEEGDDEDEADRAQQQRT